MQNIRDYGGAFVSDVVGLGKSFIGAAIVKRFEQTERARPLIICPPPLLDMWERYNENLPTKCPCPFNGAAEGR